MHLLRLWVTWVECITRLRGRIEYAECNRATGWNCRNERRREREVSRWVIKFKVQGKVRLAAVGNHNVRYAVQPVQWLVVVVLNTIPMDSPESLVVRVKTR